MSSFEDQTVSAPEPSRATADSVAASPFENSDAPSPGQPMFCGAGRPVGWRRQVGESPNAPFDAVEEGWEYWFHTVVGVAFAGGAYGLPVFIIGGPIGFLIAGFFALALVVPFAMAVRAVCGHWRHPLAAPCFGGLIGYVSIAAWTPLVIDFQTDLGWIALGPMLSTLVGQTGGYLATRYRAIEMILRRQRRPVERRWQFSISAALIGTASVALLLTLLRWWRPLELRELYSMALWLPWQIALLFGFSRLGRRSARRWQQLPSRFT